MNLTGTPRVALSGADASMFNVDTQPSTPVAASGTTTFQITFAPASEGAKTATITIANDDLNEDPYVITLNGTGTTPGLEVRESSNIIWKR